MPPTVIIAIVLLGLSAGLNLLNVITGTGNIFSLLISVALLVGVIKGSEGTRTVVIVLCGIGIVFGLIGLLMLGTADTFVTAALIYGLVVNGVVIWCMNHKRTRAWMTNRALGLDESA